MPLLRSGSLRAGKSIFRQFPVQIAGITTNTGKHQVKQTVQPQIIEICTDADGHPLISLGEPGSIILLVAAAGDKAFLQMKEGAQKTDNNLISTAARDLASRVEKNRNTRRTINDTLSIMEMKYGDKIVTPDIIIDRLVQFNILAFDYHGATPDPTAFTLVQYSDTDQPASVEALLLVYPPVLNRIEKEAMRQMPQPAGDAALLKQVQGSFIKDVEKAVNKGANEVGKVANDAGHAVSDAATDVGQAVVQTANDAGQAVVDTTEGANAAFEALEGVNVNQVAQDAQDGNQAAVMNDLATVGPNRAQDQVMDAGDAEAEADVAAATAEETTEFAIIGAPARTQALQAMPAQRSHGILANEPDVDELLEYRFSVFASKA